MSKSWCFNYIQRPLCFDQVPKLKIGKDLGRVNLENIGHVFVLTLKNLTLFHFFAHFSKGENVFKSVDASFPSLTR